MIYFKLDPEHFMDLGINCEIIPVHKSNLGLYIHFIESSITHFNQEIEWSGMFSPAEANVRINDGMTMYILTNNVDIFGYVWFKDENDGRTLFNLFVRNQIPLKPHSGKEFVSDVISRFENNKTIYCEVDEWNTKSLRLFERLGFQVQ